MASLVLAEIPEVKASALVTDLLGKEAFWDNLRNNLEFQGALGGQVLKILLGGKGIGLEFVRAYNFFPVAWDNTTVTEAIFVDRRSIGGKHYARIETHKRDVEGEVEGYRVTNKLYDEDSDVEVNLDILTDAPDPDVFIPSPYPLFVYIRNPEANNIDPESPLGISLYANAVDSVETLDMAFDQFFGDIETGGRRIALPGEVFNRIQERQQDGTMKQIRVLDPSDRAFMRLQGDDMEKFKVQDLTVDIRADQFRQAIQLALDVFAIQIGFDAGFYTFDGTSVTTATEVISDNSHTYKTITTFRENLDKALRLLFASIDSLGRVYELDGAGAEEDETNLIWDDSVIEDRNSKATYWNGRYTAGTASLETCIKHMDGLTDEAAAEEAKKIADERRVVTADSLIPMGG